MMTMSSSSVDDWQLRFMKEVEEGQKLRHELEETRAKYDSLLEASLQQMAARLDSVNMISNNTSSANERFKRLSPGSTHPLTPLTLSSSSSHPNLYSTNNMPNIMSPSSASAPATPMSSDSHPLTNSTSEKKSNTPRKKFFGLGKNKSKDKTKEKESKGGSYQADDDYRSDFVLPLAPGTSYQHLPRLVVCPLASRNHVVISGPAVASSSSYSPPSSADDTNCPYYEDIVACRSTSTYPHIPGDASRDGDPIADRFSAQVFENRVIAAVGDGCNWGSKPREAANKATSAFVDYVSTAHDSISDVKKAGAVLLNAFEFAHNSIMEGKNAVWDVGTTTLLGGILLEINKGTDKWTPQWEFVCASVGDCKAFCFANGEITDITQGNRKNVNDPRDPGGRLGPHLDEGKPDLRNLNLFCTPCEDGDVIIIVTDGVHDNLDPHHLGKLPKDMPKEFNLSGDKWEDLDPAKAMYAKNAYITDLLIRILKSGDDTPTPKQIAERLVTHCIDVTRKSREYMENNQGKRLPEDYVEFPGKMDHTTCLCFRVGRFTALPEKGTVTSTGILSTSPAL